MSGIWYCRSCGYEVSKGGRCHNCHEGLIETDLTELAEGEVDDEVGYRLDEWEDEPAAPSSKPWSRRASATASKDDELVIGADDEASVDAIAPRSRAAPSTTRVAKGSTTRRRSPPWRPCTTPPPGCESIRRTCTPTGIWPRLCRGVRGGAALRRRSRDLGRGRPGHSPVARRPRRRRGARGDIARQAAILCRLLEPIAAPRGG